jgi:predicted Rossmann fold nucleotide-binding protein DprA/Smf involved in DNA uptake
VTRSLDLPALDRIDTLAQELAMLQDRGKRRIAILGSRHVPVVSIHLVELVARSLAQEGHSLITSGAQGVNSAVIRSVLDVDPARLTVLLPQSLDRQPRDGQQPLQPGDHQPL